MGLLLVSTKKTANGNPYNVVVNPSKLSEEHAGILFDAFELKHISRTGYTKAPFPLRLLSQKIMLMLRD